MGPKRFKTIPIRVDGFAGASESLLAHLKLCWCSFWGKSIITPCKQLGQPGFLFFSHTTEAGHNQNENWLLATCSVLLPTVVQIKGSPIYPLVVGSCLGYCMIPYFCQSDVRCQYYINPTAQNAAILLAWTVWLLSCHAYQPSAWVLICPSCPAWQGVTCYCLSGIF